MDEPTPEPIETPPPEPDRAPSSPSVARQVLLGFFVFGTALLVLAGLVQVVSRRDDAGAAATATPAPTVAAVATATPVASPSASASASTGAASTAPTASPTATTTASGDPVLVGAGDIADCTTGGDEATANLLAQIPGTIFTAGDNVYPAASTTSFAECFAPTWGRFLDRIRPAAGNHDWQDGGIKAYRRYFADQLPADGRTWYAYDLGTWRIIVLDSDCKSVGGCGAESEQGRWLADELATNQARCTLAIWHHPRFSSGDEHGDDPAVDPFWRALYAAGADVVINGHDHDYEVFAPQDPKGRLDRARGIREFVVGTGGTALRGFDDPRPNSELRAAISNGVLALTLHDGSYEWRFIPTEGPFADRGGAACH